jgi:hypothetical protein
MVRTFHLTRSTELRLTHQMNLARLSRNPKVPTTARLSRLGFGRIQSLPEEQL